MSSALYLTEQSIKSIKKIEKSTFLILLIILFVNIYGLYSTILGKLITLMCVIYLILNNNITFVIIAFLIVLLNNSNIENFENNNKKVSKTNKNETHDHNDEKHVDDINKNKTNVELNDSIASFKTKHCKNGKLIDKHGNYINVSDLSNVFPNIKFNIENEKCNPCEDNCKFKLTSDIERINVEEKLRPTSSSKTSSN